MEWNIITLDEIDSTNEYAKRIAPTAPEGTVVVARHQTAGKGRKGRRWTSPRGGLWMSVVLKPRNVDPRLVFVGALAVVDLLEDFGIRAGIKWPNDVWAEGRKIAGILTEGKGHQYVVLGIGLNVNNPIPEDLKETAISMSALLGKRLPIEMVLRKLLKHLARWYGIFLREPERIVEGVRKKTFILGRAVMVTTGEGIVSGRALDVLDDGSLLVESPTGIMKIVYGDVSLRIGEEGRRS